MIEAIVIGGGVLGASVAYRLAQAGVLVTVLEKAHVGAGTSGASFAWTNSIRKPPRAYHDLNVKSMALYLTLGEEFDDTSWFRVTGNAEWTRSEEDRWEQQERIKRLHAWGYRADWIEPRDLMKLEPDLSPSALGEAQIAYFPDDGLVDPICYASAMMGAAVRRYGAKLHLGKHVAHVGIRSGRVVAVTTRDGERFEADVFVNCAGRWVNEVALNDPTLTIPMAPTVGFLVFTPPTPTTITRPLHAPEVNIRPDGAGRLMMRSNDGDYNAKLEEPSGVSSRPAIEMMSAATRLLPALGEMRPEATRTTLRSIPFDDISVLGTFPHVENYYICVTHSGVTLAPILGKLVAEEIAMGRAEIDLEPFRPTRFASSATA